MPEGTRETTAKKLPPSVVTNSFAPLPLDGGTIRTAFERASPFRHAVIENFFPEDVALELHRSFPKFTTSETVKARLFSGRVYGAPPEKPGSVFRAANTAMASSDFIRQLSEIAGIERLAMDRTQDGAGAHVGLRGSALPIHADHNTHPRAPWLYRRLNLLVYLNPNWRPSWQSNLLLYDRAGRRKVTEIEPRFNRAILMDVHDHAFHGYRALKVPYGESRQMLASYFYSPEPSPDQTREAHASIFAAPEDLGPAMRTIMRGRRVLLHYFRHLAPAPSWTDHRD